MKRQPTGFVFEVCDRDRRPARQDRLVFEYEPFCNRAFAGAGATEETISFKELKYICVRSVRDPMVIGKHYRLSGEVMAIEVVARGKHFACNVPMDAEIEVTGGPNPDGRMFDVRWGERAFIMFADDIALQCNEIQAKQGDPVRRDPASEHSTGQGPRFGSGS